VSRHPGLPHIAQEISSQVSLSHDPILLEFLRSVDGMGGLGGEGEGEGEGAGVVDWTRIVTTCGLPDVRRAGTPLADATPLP
jgi:hypothetical protein